MVWPRQSYDRSFLPAAELFGWAVTVALFATLMFRALLAPGAILFCTDDNIGALAQRKAAFPEIFLTGWNDQSFIGTREMVLPSWTNALLWILPPKTVNRLLHALDLSLASLFLVAFLRRRGCGRIASAIGALTACWLGSNFTLVYAGHIGKFGVMLFASLALWLTDRALAVLRRPIAAAAAAGGAWGAMFLEQPDVALFWAAALGGFLLFRLHEAFGWNLRRWGPRLIPMALVAGLIAVQPLVAGYTAAVKPAKTGATDAETHWNFITQWSWPPEETIDFIAPGYTGWRTGEPEGPYWGRLGQSPEWPLRREGFRNFKLENHYIGAIPFLLAATAILGAARTGKRSHIPPQNASATQRARETFFWTGVAIATFMLALGKFTPLYRLVIALPGFGAVRAPVKWLQPFQIAVAILAAFGWDVYRRCQADADRHRTFGALAAAAAIAAVLLGFVAAHRQLHADAWRAPLAAEWGDAASALVKNTTRALARGALSMAVGAGVFLAALHRSDSRRTRLRLAVAGGLCLGMPAADAWLLSRHYVHRLPPSLIAKNDLIRDLRKHLGADRLVVAPQDFYGPWLTFLFPYHGIRTLNFTQMPRMPDDVRAWLEAVASRPLHYWRSAGATLLLMPAELWERMQADAVWRATFEPVGVYRIIGAPDGGFTAVAAASPTGEGLHYLLRDRQAIGRFRLFSRFEIRNDADMLALLQTESDAVSPLVRVAPEHAKHIPALLEEAEPGGEVRIEHLGAGRMVLRVRSRSPAVLRIADHYDPFWRARLDGVPHPVLRADYLFMAVTIPAGEHRLEIVRELPRWPLNATLAGIGLWGLALIVLALSNRERRPAP